MRNWIKEWLDNWRLVTVAVEIRVKILGHGVRAGQIMRTRKGKMHETIKRFRKTLVRIRPHVALVPIEYAHVIYNGVQILTIKRED